LELDNTVLLVCEAVVYFTAMAVLFRMRRRFGLGVLVAALGTLHFLETYLAATVYVPVPLGLALSPGSTVLFSGKLAVLLMVYIREDAAAVRQPIYGILFGNFLIVAIAAIVRLHAVPAEIGGRLPDFAFLDQMGLLMVWGTLLLFVDCIVLILLYERLGSWLASQRMLRIGLSLAAILTFDQAGFYLGLKLLIGAPLNVLVGGWAGKMVAVVIYAGMSGIYLRLFESRRIPSGHRRLSDIFDVLTYRERYHALLERTGRDGLTGLYDRGRLELEGAGQVEEALRRGGPLSLLLVDVDHFKSVNDRHGHTRGDAMLRLVASKLGEVARNGDAAYRYGGEEFLMICPGLAQGSALLVAERLRREIAAASEAAGTPVTVSIGLATTPPDGASFAALFSAADDRLYRAKATGRNRVLGIVDQVSEGVEIDPGAQPEGGRPAARWRRVIGG
jgi:diguanylate cyclase (GGDEF)-like protein